MTDAKMKFRFDAYYLTSALFAAAALVSYLSKGEQSAAALLIVLGAMFAAFGSGRLGGVRAGRNRTDLN